MGLLDYVLGWKLASKLFGDSCECALKNEGCPAYDSLEILCNETGGKLDNGKRAECYKSFKKDLKKYGFNLNIGGKITKGIMNFIGLDD